MTLPFWADDTEAARAAWNTVILGPVTIPGVCVVKAKKGRDVDVNKSKGKDGPSAKDNGAGQGKVNIEVTLSTREQWKEWQRIRPTIDPNRPGGVRHPLEIQHPECADRGIKDVYIDDIQGLPPTARGGKKYLIECSEWVPAPKASQAKTKTLPAAKVRQNSVVSNVAGETEAGQDFVKKLTENSFE